MKTLKVYRLFQAENEIHRSKIDLFQVIQGWFLPFGYSKFKYKHISVNQRLEAIKSVLKLIDTSRVTIVSADVTL